MILLVETFFGRLSYSINHDSPLNPERQSDRGGNGVDSGAFSLNAFWQRKWPNAYSRVNFGIDKKPWYVFFRRVLFLLLSVCYLFGAADFYGMYKKIEILDQDDIFIHLIDNKVKTGKLIGKTKDVIFLLHNDGVSALPISSAVKEIEIK